MVIYPRSFFSFSVLGTCVELGRTHIKPNRHTGEKLVPIEAAVKKIGDLNYSSVG